MQCTYIIDDCQDRSENDENICDEMCSSLITIIETQRYVRNHHVMVITIILMKVNSCVVM